MDLAVGGSHRLPQLPLPLGVGRRKQIFLHLYRLVLATVGRMLHWPHGRARCVLSDDGIESVQYFVNDCRFLAPCRARMMREICSALPLAGDVSGD